MAAPSFNLNLTTLSTCETTTGWSIGSVDDEIYQQGTASLSESIRNGGTAVFTPATAQDMSAPNTHLRLWFFHTFAANLQTKANGGIRLFVNTGNSRNEYFVGGSDTHEGAWELLSANLAAPDIDGGADLANITSCGYIIVHADAARNLTNTWWDFFTYGTGYEVYGGTPGDRVTWDDIAAADRANGYGVVQSINGVNFLNSRLILGDRVGSNNLYFDGSGELSVYYDVGESADLYQIIVDGNSTGTTDAIIRNTVMKSASTSFDFLSNSASTNTVEITGTQFNRARNSIFKSGQIINDNVFIECGMITPSTAAFHRNAISGYVGAQGALYLQDSISMSDISFTSSGSGHAIYIDTPGTYNLVNFSYNGYGATGTTEAVIYNNSGGEVTINVSGGDSPTYRNGTGATTTVLNTVAITLTGMKDNTEVRVFDLDKNPVAGIEDAIDGSANNRSFTFSAEGGDIVNIRVFNINYQPADILGYTVPSTNATIPIQQVFDRVVSI